MTDYIAHREYSCLAKPEPPFSLPSLNFHTRSFSTKHSSVHFTRLLSLRVVQVCLTVSVFSTEPLPQLFDSTCRREPS